MEKEKKNDKFHKDVLEKVEKTINNVVETGISLENVDFLYKLVDIHKDICNEEYWKIKKEDIEMRYKNYGRDPYGENEMGNYGLEGNYGRRSRDSRGRYTGRGQDMKYRGEETLGEMYRNYQGYSEGKEEYGRGNYGAKEDTMESLDYMMQSVVEFVKMLEKDATSQDEVDLIKHYTKKISGM